MRLKYIISIVLIIGNNLLSAQSEIDIILNQIETNNKTLISARQKMEVDIWEHKSNLFPDNPDITYGYFPGNNPVIGNKEVIGIHQNFSFPLSYITNGKISRTHNELSKFEYQIIRQEVLLQTKLNLYDLIFKQQQFIEYEKRLKNATKLNESNKQQLESGNISVIEANKAKVLLIVVESKYKKIEQELLSIENELVKLNGGVTIQLSITDYNDQKLLSLDSIKNELFNKLPQLKFSNYLLELALLNKKSKKQNWFPDFQIGYQAEKESQGTFRGIHAGISIPLWNNINKVKSAKANVIFAENKQDEERSNYLATIEMYYAKAKKYQSILDDIENTMDVAMNVSLLNKAFEKKEISVIEYINEISFYNELIDIYLETKKEYYQTLALLYIYRL
ncbi:TolC family protein [Bacteroidota bacterium]